MLRNILTLSALIAAVLLVRAVFRNRVPKRMLYALWLVVLLKLCLPGTLVSLPILPAQETAAPIARAELPVQATAPTQQPVQAVTQPQESVQQPVSPAREAPKLDAKPLTAAQIFPIVWLCGSVLLGLWLFGAWLVFTLRLQKSRRFLGKRGRTRIYVSDAVSSPCLAGLLPAVYLTQDVLQTEEAELILRHELTHLHHLDFLWSFCRAVAVAVYWWNPLVWLAAICSKRDAELACDEAVAAGLDQTQRLAYARAILAQAPRKKVALSLAGPPIKERILFLTKKQRTSVLCVILALLLVVSATGCSFAELTQKKSGEIMLPDETFWDADSAAQDEMRPAQQDLNTISADSDLTHDEIWALVHEKLDSAHWAQNMTPEYEEAIRVFQTMDSKQSGTSGDVSQWPHYYSAFIEYFSDTNADLSYLDEDAFWTMDLSEDGQTLIVTMTSGNGDTAALTLSYSLQTQRIRPSVIMPLPAYDPDRPLQVWELTNAFGAQTGMTQAEVEALVGKLSPDDTGNRLYDEQRLSYRFWDRSGGEPKLMELSWNAAVENDEIIFETAQDTPAFRGICLGDTIDTVLEKFPCADQDLKNQQSQTLYGQDGDADSASLHLIADSYYSLSFYIDGQWRASIDFSRVQQRAFRIVIYGNGYWQPGE